MALSREDQAVVAEMEQRQLHLKRRQRATSSMQFELKRYETLVVAAVVAAVVVLDVALYAAAVSTFPTRPAWWLLGLVSVAVAGALGVTAGRELLRRPWGRRLVARKAQRLRDKYSGDLHAGRRWLEFYYRDEDVAAYVPQILSFIETGRFDSVGEALAYAKETSRRKGDIFADRAAALFADVASRASVLVLSSVDDDGQPVSRLMRFVTTDRPGTWYVTRSPQGTKEGELDTGRIAVVTVPTDAGATITSTRASIRRAEVAFADVAALFDARVPGFSDGMTEEEAALEAVYELTIEDATVDTWSERVGLHPTG
ncbi:hypothetical protein [Demequina iriomotensis]|uniref:hypothetical protein n=1 Tax=Demequina iriomotensis TaxID=1536641 RepID=UPI0007865F24|nr:hypothetical protein [Demequina iriomotensis]